MAYELQVKLPNGRYKSLDISKSDKLNSSDLYADYSNSKHYKINGRTFDIRDNFERMSQKYTFREIALKNRAPSPKYSLKTLDLFTSQFEDEWSLKLHLVSSGILTPELIYNPLVIRYVTEKKERKNYKVFYLDDQYYFEIDKLIGLIENRYLNCDWRFLKALARHFGEFKECQTTAGELLAATTETKATGYISNGFKETDSNGDNVITRLPKLLIYKYAIKPNGDPLYLIGEKNYRTFHLLIEFIRDYEQRELEETKKIAVTPQQKDVKGKKREPEPSVLDGQMGFKDLPNY